MSVNLNINTNQVFVSSSQNQILVEDRNNGIILNIEQPINKTIEITSPGPRGSKGDKGDSVFTDIGNNTFSATSSFQITGSLSVTQGVTGSFTGSLFGTSSNAINALTASFAPNYTTTSSFNQFTQSYYQDSSSLDIRIDNLEQFSSSLDATFATDNELNQATASLSASIGVLNTNFNQFTSSYNTGSFTGSFTGTSSFAVSSSNARSASFASTASFITPLNQNVLISGSLKFDPTQDPDPLGLDLDSTVLFQSSSNTTLGYDLYFRQNGNLVKWKWIEGVLETGLLYGGVVTYSGSNVFVSPGSGIIVEHNATTSSEISPMVQYVTWNAITQSVANIATQQVTYIYIDQNGDLQQQSSRFTAQEYHNYIPLGAVGHFDYTQVSAFGGAVQTAYDQISQTSNFIDAFGPLKVSGYGLTGQANSLRLSVGTGTSFIHGGFYQNDPEFPSQATTPSQTTASLARVQRSGSSILFDTNGGNLYTTVDPTRYDRDGNGVLQNVGSGNWSIQRVFSDPKTGVLYVYYGQARYTSLLNALQYLPTDPFTEGDTFDFTTFIGFLVLKGNASDITDTAANQIIPAGLFRGSGQGSGGGIALSNLDDLTDVSITNPVNGQALVYNSGIWQSGNPTSASFALTSSFATTALTTPSGIAIIGGTGTTNFLPKFTNTSTLSDSLLFDNGTNIGIGTTTPQDRIHLTQGYFRYQFSPSFPDIHGRIGHNGNAGGFEIISQYSGTNIASGNIRFITGLIGATSERMRITPGGDVGIGTTTPDSRVQIVPLANQTALNLSSYSLTGTGDRPLLDLSGTWNTTGTPTAIRLNVTDTASNANSRLLDIQVGGNSLVSTFKTITRFNQSIYVGGVDTTNSQTALFATAGGIGVSGGGSIRDFFANRGFITTGTATAAFTFFEVAGAITQSTGSTGITRGLFINPTLTNAFDFRAIETTVGNVTLNTTSGNTSIGKINPNAKLDVNGNTVITGSLTVTQGITGSLFGTASFAISSSNAQTASFAQSGNGSFSGSFSGSGANLFNIPASGITGLNLSQISSGSVSASISPQNGLQVNTNINLDENNLKTNELQFSNSNSFVRPSNDVRNWYLTGNTYSVTTNESSPTGIFFKPDGTRFYIIGTTLDSVLAYNMTVAWDIKTATISENFSVSVETAPSDLFFKNDGTILYILGQTTDLVRQFSLPTPWILTGATPTGTFNVSTQDGAPTGIYLREDGLKMYIAGDSSPDKVIEYNLSIPWDITTSVFLQSFSVFLEETAISGISFSDDGIRMYIVGTLGDDITEYRLTIPWDISTASYFSESFTFIQEATPQGLYYNGQENKAFVIGTTNDTIIELGTTQEIKLFSNSTITDGQLYVGGRFEAKSSIYANSTINALGIIASSLGLSTSNTTFVSSTATLSQPLINIGSFTSTTVPTVTNINISNGRFISGQTKNIAIARNSQFGSTTSIIIGDANTGSLISTLDSSFKRDVDILGSLSIDNGIIPIISSATASGITNVLDNFTEATNTLLNLHTPNIGGTWQRIQISNFTTPTFTVFSTGLMGVTSNRDNEGVIYIQSAALTNPNYEVSVNLVTQASSDDVMYLFARYQDQDNFYCVRWSTTTSNCGLYKKVAGVFILLSTLSITPQTGASTLSLRVYDNYVIVLNGGAVVMTAFDDSIILPGQAGIGAGNILIASGDDFLNWRFDNFKVQAYENNFKPSYIKNGNLLIGTTTDVSSSKLTIDSTTQGFLPPRMTNAQRLAISSPAVGLIVYCTNAPEGLYINKSTGWTFII